MILRGDAVTDPAARHQHYLQALGIAPPASPVHLQARRKRAGHLLAISVDAPMTGTLRKDLVEAAHELEALGEAEQAAQAYGRAGDVEGQARALAGAGDVDRLDALLLEQQGHDRRTIERREIAERVTMLAAAGKRREAAAMALATADDALRARGRTIEQRKVSGDVVDLVLRGTPMRLALGEEVVVGRVATISVASAAVSRQHVVIARRGAEVVVRDVGSRNRTTLAGLTLAGEAVVGGGIELKLGNEVPLVVRPADELTGAVAIEVAGMRYLAPLGPAVLGVGGWRLERGADGWVELVTGDDPPAYVSDLAVAGQITLLAGDAIATGRGEEPVLRMEGA